MSKKHEDVEETVVETPPPKKYGHVASALLEVAAALRLVGTCNDKELESGLRLAADYLEKRADAL